MAPMPSSVWATGIWVFSAKLAQLVHRAGEQDAVPGQDDRPLGRLDRLGGQAQLAWVALEGRLEAGQVDRVGMGGARLRHQRVLGDVDVDGPGAAGARDVERLGEDARQVVGVADQEVVLGHRQRDAGDVDLLEGVLADQRAGHVAGDGDHRDASPAARWRCR